MTTFVLLHGAGSDGWYWHRVRPGLEALGHATIAPDLPVDDERAGLDTLADVAVAAGADAAPGDDEIVVVGQSLAGFVAPQVAARVGARGLVLVAPMIPRPGETAGEWWANTGWHDARRAAAARAGRAVSDEIDPVAEFLHDVDPEVVNASADHVRPQATGVFKDPWPLAAWPDIATRVVACRDDRFFPLDLVQRVARERLGIEPEQLPGGHLPALAHPDELVAVLAARGPAPLP